MDTFVPLITKRKQFEELIASPHYTVVQYFATWCCFCGKFDPVFERAAEHEGFTQVAQFYRIDCSRNTSENKIAQRIAKVKGFPHVGVFCVGKLVGSVSGYCEWDEFEPMVSEFIFSAKSPPPKRIPRSRSTDNLVVPDSPSPPPIRPTLSLFSGHNRSNTSLTTVSTGSILSSCTGLHKDRNKGRWYERLLRMHKPFHDPEPGCVFVPTDAGEGLQIGKDNEGHSFFNITLSRPNDRTKQNQVIFGMGFIPDTTDNMRFTSALFRVTFGMDDDDGVSDYLKVQDMLPRDEHGAFTEVHWGKGREGNVNMSVGYSAVSLGGESKFSKNAEYTRRTFSWVRGCGIHTSTAEWTFQEDDGQAGRHGLNPQYQLSVTLPQAVTGQTIWMEFWAKAVLARRTNHAGLVTLKIGSEDKPYKRNLVLSSGVSTVHDDEVDSAL